MEFQATSRKDLMTQISKTIGNKLPPCPTDLDILKVSWLKNKKTWHHNKRLWKKFCKNPSNYVSKRIYNEIKFRRLGTVIEEELKSILDREPFLRRALILE
jgi:hypothetical protein